MLLLMMMLCRRKLKTGDAAAGVDIRCVAEDAPEESQ